MKKSSSLDLACLKITDEEDSKKNTSCYIFSSRFKREASKKNDKTQLNISEISISSFDDINEIKRFKNCIDPEDSILISLSEELIKTKIRISFLG